jgi:hypothetical protein
MPRPAGFRRNVRLGDLGRGNVAAPHPPEPQPETPMLLHCILGSTLLLSSTCLYPISENAAVPTAASVASQQVYPFSGLDRRATAAHWVYAHDGRLDRETGRLTFRGEVRTFEAFSGFRAAVRVEFVDAQGRLLWAIESSPLGVDGTGVPFSAPSQRFVDVAADIPVQAARLVAGHRVRVQHYPHEPGALLRANLERMAEILGG